MRRLADLWREPGQQVVLSQEEADDAQRLRNSLNEPGKTLCVKEGYADRFQRAFVAQALASDALSPAGFYLARSRGSLEQLADRISKAYAVYPLPIYAFHFARVLDAAGQANDATVFFQEFQRLQSRFQPDEFDERIQDRYDVAGAVAEAAERAMNGRVDR